MNYNSSQLEKTLKALANRRRLKIMKYLQSVGSASVITIAKEIKSTFRTASKHLRLLKNIDILECDQKRFENHYRLITPLHPLVKFVLAMIK